tara:strand:- start:574 stop:714 length:141 start_codon:yes stop_codon:yes gene_type:complete
MGKQKTIYMTDDQIKQLSKVQDITKESDSTIIRKGIEMYLVKIKEK